MNSNDLKVKEYKKKKLIKYTIIGLSFLTIVLESFALFQMISYLWGLIPFALCYIIKYFYAGNRSKKREKR